MERRAGQWLGRSSRRLLVVAIYFGLFAYTAETPIGGNSWWIFAAGLLGIGATMVIYGSLLLPFTQKIADKKESELDERQVAIRNRAHRTAYQILGSLVIVALVYTQISLDYFSNSPWAPSITEDSMTAVALGAIWLIITLPTSIIAWTEPDVEG